MLIKKKSDGNVKIDDEFRKIAERSLRRNRELLEKLAKI
jgi:hypothetical protein